MYKKMTHDEWIEKYKPISSDDETISPFMLETYGSDLQRVRRTKPEFIWTLLTDDDGEMLITNGYCFVNRLGYFITEVPHENNEIIEVEY